MIISGQYDHASDGEEPTDQFLMVKFAKLMVVIAGDSGRWDIVGIKVEESLSPVISGQDFPPVIALDLHVAETLMDRR